MASKNLFAGQRSIPKGVLPVDTVNEAGGVAYQFGPEHALAQYALTGTFNGTYYATDAEQMQKTLEFAAKCDPLFVAQVAVYAREKGYMKDMPAFLLAYLATKDASLMKKVFPRVVDSPKMIRNFVQMIRSGALGRKSLGTAPKKLVTNYLNGLTDDQVFRADVGNSPSLQDILKMVHPTPKTAERGALYGYLLGIPRGEEGKSITRKRKDGSTVDVRTYDFNKLCDTAKEYEAFTEALSESTSESEKNKLVPPNVPFLMLTALPLTKEHWKGIARRATWTQLRMNLNSFQKHGVFEDAELTKALAAKLASKDEITRAKAFPYQLFAAYTYLGPEVPQVLRTAVIDAADIAIDNVPAIDGDVVVMPDVSGSMSSPITGNRPGATSKMRCIDIAALIAAAVLRKNPNATVLPFEHDVKSIRLNPRDSVLTNAEKLAAIGGGGTNCSAPLAYLNARGQKADLLWFVSDNESWVDHSAGYYGQQGATGVMAEFTKLKTRSPGARLVNLDIQPYHTTQAHERADILNVGGFSDTVFEVVSMFASGGADAKTLVNVIKGIDL